MWPFTRKSKTAEFSDAKAVERARARILGAGLVFLERRRIPTTFVWRELKKPGDCVLAMGGSKVCGLYAEKLPGNWSIVELYVHPET